MSNAYYNENDPYAAQWLRNLIAGGKIAAGDVDERSIKDVRADDLAGYRQCHFFAGIGVWSYALRAAGWPDELEVWTGSCPCQPFSAAGFGEGFADPRHLWPEWYRLIEERAPRVVFGEQVASTDGLAWLDLVHADLEAADYAVAPIDLCAAGVGAPHRRQRLYFVADSDRLARGQGCAQPSGSDRRGDAQQGAGPRCSGSARDMADADGRNASTEGLQRGGQHGLEPQDGRVVRLADHHQSGRSIKRRARLLDGERSALWNDADRRGPVNGFWRDAEWIACTDGKARPIEPGTFPLAHGVAGRVGRLRAYGNAIVAPQAVEVVSAFRSLFSGGRNVEG